MAVIDVDNEETWTPEIKEQVSRWADRCRGKTSYANDLPLSIEQEEGFRALFLGHRLRVYHCTKLLPHEITAIRVQGLRPLSLDLLEERIRAARDAGALSFSEAEQLLTGHVFAKNEQRFREKQICFVLSRRVFCHQPHGCWPLLSTWGGEGIYAALGTQQLRGRLESIGIPSVIQAAIDLSVGRDHKFFSPLHKTFVGVALDLDDAGSDVFYNAAVSPVHIERILHEGDPLFDSLELGTSS